MDSLRLHDESKAVQKRPTAALDSRIAKIDDASNHPAHDDLRDAEWLRCRRPAPADAGTSTRNWAEIFRVTIRQLCGR
jgi:hypothetical protein